MHKRALFMCRICPTYTKSFIIGYCHWCHMFPALRIKKRDWGGSGRPGINSRVSTNWVTWFCFYQTRSAWSMDQGSNKNHSPINNFTPTVTKFCFMWEGQALPHDTKFRNCAGEIVDSRAFSSWSLIHGSSWSGLIKAEPGDLVTLCLYDDLGQTNVIAGILKLLKRFRMSQICMSMG